METKEEFSAGDPPAKSNFASGLLKGKVCLFLQ